MVERAGRVYEKSLTPSPQNTQHDRHRNSQRCSGPRPWRPQHSYVHPPAATRLSTHAPLGTGRPCHDRAAALTVCSCHQARDVRCETSPRLPRLMRSPTHSSEQMPPCELVPALEVPGTIARDLSHVQRWILDAPEYLLTQSRMRGIHTRSANTRSSS
jgi:hypothetical protein